MTVESEPCSRPHIREQAVPRYFFDVHDGKVALDTTGTELEDHDAAREKARRIVVGLAFDITLQRDAVQLRVHVRDEAGTRVHTGTLLFLIEAVQ